METVRKSSGFLHPCHDAAEFRAVMRAPCRDAAEFSRISVGRLHVFCKSSLTCQLYSGSGCCYMFFSCVQSFKSNLESRLRIQVEQRRRIEKTEGEENSTQPKTMVSGDPSQVCECACVRACVRVRACVCVRAACVIDCAHAPCTTYCLDRRGGL